jgi:hypothetical protein
MSLEGASHGGGDCLVGLLFQRRAQLLLLRVGARHDVQGHDIHGTKQASPRALEL